MPSKRHSNARLLLSAIRYFESLHATINELNERTKRIAARQTSLERSNVELQEACFNYWNTGRNLAVLRQEATSKVTYDMVYNFYQKELFSLGVTSLAIFEKLLDLRRKRLNRINGNFR